MVCRGMGHSRAGPRGYRGRGGRDAEQAVRVQQCVPRLGVEDGPRMREAVGVDLQHESRPA
jgi:hypothetical protein